MFEQYDTDGFERVGQILDDSLLARLRDKADELMLGGHDRLFFQHDAQTGRYDDLPRRKGWQGPSRQYRKIEKLERIPEFRAAIDAFESIAKARIEGGIVLYRAVLFTKSEHGGTELPWHQDGGSFWGLSEDPSLQIWTALDEVPEESGCVEVVPGTHRNGLATPLGGVIPDNVAGNPVTLKLPAKAGETILIHNYLWHRSGVNRTGKPRRALTICLMSEKIACTRKKRAPRSFLPLYRRP